VLEKYRPEVIICWGKNLWKNLPSSGVRGVALLDEKMRLVPTWEYILSDGFVVKMMCVNHPSAGFSWDKWYRVIMEFLKG